VIGQRPSESQGQRCEYKGQTCECQGQMFESRGQRYVRTETVFIYDTLYAKMNQIWLVS